MSSKGMVLGAAIQLAKLLERLEGSLGRIEMTVAEAQAFGAIKSIVHNLPGRYTCRMYLLSESQNIRVIKSLMRTLHSTTGAAEIEELNKLIALLMGGAVEEVEKVTPNGTEPIKGVPLSGVTERGEFVN